MHPVSVAIVDTSDLSRYGLAALLSQLGSYVNLVAMADNLTALQAVMREKTVEVVLLDDLLPGSLTLESALITLRALNPTIRVILISQKLNAAYVQTVLQRGIHGYLYKPDVLPQELSYALNRMECSQIYLSPQVVAITYTAPAWPTQPTLTARDLNVLELMQHGRTVQQMALQLTVNDRAIYRSQHKLRQGLGVPTTELIVAAALERGWITELGSI